MNNTLHLKTKNLRQAMKNLDLITEEEESAMQKQFNKTKPDNLFTYGNKTTSNEDKYDDMDKFAKTLLTSSDWGASALKLKKRIFLLAKYHSSQEIQLMDLIKEYLIPECSSNQSH